jgi:hypothetical protein
MKHETCNILKNLLLLFLFVTCCMLHASFVHAQEVLPLTLFPAIQDKMVKAGDKTRMQVQIKNGSSSPLSGNVKVADYVISDKEGTPRLVEGGNIKPKYGAAAWITAQPNQVTIPANDFVTIDLYVNIPAEISNCGHYAIVYFQPITQMAPAKGGRIESSTAVTFKIGGLLNFEVTNKVCREELNISNFQAPKFLEYGPINLQFDLLNNSDIHLTPKATLVLTNNLGKTVSQQTINDKRIFPETIKTYMASIGNKWMLGQYKIDLTAVYGSENKSVNGSVYVIVFPWKIALIVLLAIIIIILLSKKLITKEARLEEELKKEKEEVEELKKELHQ